MAGVMAEERKAFLLRIRPELWDEINRLAQRELRSVNAQIEFMLREALRKRGVARGGEVQERKAVPGERDGA